MGVWLWQLAMARRAPPAMNPRRVAAESWLALALLLKDQLKSPRLHPVIFR